MMTTYDNYTPPGWPGWYTWLHPALASLARDPRVLAAHVVAEPRPWRLAVAVTGLWFPHQFLTAFLVCPCSCRTPPIPFFGFTSD